MAYKYTVASKVKDPTNGNIVVTVNFIDDQNPGVTYTDKFFAFDLTDAIIDDWARSKIEVFTKRDQNFALVTTGSAKTPADPDPRIKTLNNAQAAYSKALLKAQVASLNDSDLSAAFDALVQAQEALGL